MPSDGAGRPEGWGRVVGQAQVKTSLRSALRSGRIAQAYLFTGPSGAGMDAAAVELARAALCETGGDEACGTCRHCRLTAALQHPDLFVLFPLPVGRNEDADDDPLEKLTGEDMEAVRRETALKAADPYHEISIPRANQVKVNSIRALRRQASLGAFDRGRKVFIIFDAGAMTPEAANALLKTLEEPAPGTLIVLTTPDPGSMLPTVVSRCQQVRFDPLGDAEIAEALASRTGCDPARAGLIAGLAGGSYTRALLLAGEDLEGTRNAAVGLLRAFLHKQPQEVAGLIRGLAELERDEVADTLLLLQAWIRDAMLVAAGLPPGGNADDAATLGKFVRQYPALDYGTVNDALDRAVSDLRKNVYIHLVLHALRIDLRGAAQAAGRANL
jgi:DNA polymerase-3 subunit delta'